VTSAWWQSSDEFDWLGLQVIVKFDIEEFAELID